MADNRNFPDINFVDTDTETLKNALIQAYELITGRTLYPADPARIFILWATDIVAQERVLINESAKQNLPRFAEGDYLDSLAEIFKEDVKRLPPQAAKTTLRFTISEPRTEQIIFPIGTRATVDGEIIFSTTETAIIHPGELYGDAAASCITTEIDSITGEEISIGAKGNDFVPGQIATPIDVFPYMQSVSNITTSEGGSGKETDAAFYQRMRESNESYSTAGPSGAYEYIAKSVNPLISDVKAVSATETITRTLDVNNGKAYKGGDQLLPNTLVVYPHEGSTAASMTADYTFTYDDGLLTINIVGGGVLNGENSLDISISQTMAGRVKVYILLDGGELPGPEILNAVEEALSANKKRPLTDHVSVSAPDTITFNINFTYYIPLPSEASAASIQQAVIDAVAEYKTWQTSKMGRDINPSYLEFLLMKTGIKRVEITAPVHTIIPDGKVAAFGSQNIVNGGIEDE